MLLRTKIYINLPVADLNRSRSFFEGLGLSFDDRFCDETALALRISETISAMLLTHTKFATFTPKRIANAQEMSEVLLGLQFETKAEVDKMADQALKLGAGRVREPDDYGFMYGRSFQDPDGHIWELFWMDPAQLPG